MANRIKFYEKFSQYIVADREHPLKSDTEYLKQIDPDFPEIFGYPDAWQMLFKFPNGLGASMVTGTETRFPIKNPMQQALFDKLFPPGRWEIAMLRWEEYPDDFQVLTNFISKKLTDDEAINMLELIMAMDPNQVGDVNEKH